MGESEIGHSSASSSVCHAGRKSMLRSGSEVVTMTRRTGDGLCDGIGTYVE